MLACGDGHGCGSAQLDKGVQFVDVGRLFDPARAVWLDLLRPRHRVVEIPAHEGVEHQIDVVSNGFAQFLHQCDVLDEALGAITGAVGEEPFLMAEAFGFELRGARPRLACFDRIAERAAVGLGVGSRWAPQKAIHRGLVVTSA